MSHPTSPTDRYDDSSRAGVAARPLNHFDSEAELDVFALVDSLWQRKEFIAAITGVFVALAFIYAWFIAPQMYQGAASARPTTEGSLVTLNEAGILEITPELALSRVIFEAKARGAQRAVFDANRSGFLEGESQGAPSDDEAFVEQFVPGVAIAINGVDDVTAQTILRLTFEHSSPQYAATIANALLEEAHKRAKLALVNDLQTALTGRLNTLESRLQQQELVAKQQSFDEITRLREIDAAKRLSLEDQLATLRVKDQRLREDRVKQLEEALAIAESLDLTDPQNMEVTARSSSAAPSDAKTPSISLAMSVGQEYLRGSKQLKAELIAIRNRDSNDPFSVRIRDLEAELALLERNPTVETLLARDNYLAFVDGTTETRVEIARLRGFLNQSYRDVQLMQLNQRAIAPSKASKPRRKLILAVALIAGGLTGSLIALLVNAVGNRRRPECASA